MEYFIETQSETVCSSEPKKINYDKGLLKIRKLKIEDYIGFINDKGICIQFVKQGKDLWEIDFPVLDHKGKWLYSLTDDALTTNKVEEIISFFFSNKSWEHLCNFPNPKQIAPTKEDIKSNSKEISVSKESTTFVPKDEAHNLILTEIDKKLLEQHSQLKLQIELVPANCWYSNVRSNLKRSQWDRLRKIVHEKNNFLCEICGERGTIYPVDCHEVWIYDEKTMTQRLDRFQSICPLCHEVKHIGRASMLGNGQRATSRFEKINNLDSKTAQDIKKAVFNQWRVRGKQEWKLDINLLKKYNIDVSEVLDRKNEKP